LASLLPGCALITLASSASFGMARLDEVAPDHTQMSPALLQEIAEKRAQRDSLVAWEREFRFDIDAVESIIRRSDVDPSLLRRIARSVVRESHATSLEPTLVAAVMKIENPWLKPDTASFVGATGLMQVMPLHAGNWGCESDDLTDIDVNVCHGTRILAHYLNSSRGNVDRALLRYNGCVRGTNTPDCHRYPQKVRRVLARVAYAE
jgi:soluble lytic murein transglycosylase-like protein